MTVMEKKLIETVRNLREENKHIRAGARELGQAVDAVLIGTALQYGARLPDGGMVLTMDRPAVELNAKYIVQSKVDKRGRMRVEVWERT